MFPFTTSRRLLREAELLGRAERWQARAETAQATADAALGNVRRMAATIDGQARRLRTQADVIFRLRAQLDTAPQIVRTAQRLERALKACARYRHESAQKDRLIRDQQRQLDSLLGLNDVAVLAGANWQATREDKRHGVAS